MTGHDNDRPAEDFQSDILHTTENSLLSAESAASEDVTVTFSGATSDSPFEVVETTPDHSKNGKAKARSAAARGRPVLSFEIPADKRPETVAELSKLRIEQAADILFNLGIQNVARDSIGDICEALTRYSEDVVALTSISQEMWCGVLNGYISLSQDLVEGLVGRLGFPFWAEDIIWGLFCVDVRRHPPSDKTANGEPLVPVIVYLDQATNSLQITVPDGYVIENEAAARVDNNRLYVEVKLLREL